MVFKSINKIAEILYRKGVKNIIISPGSRSAPITLAFARHQELKKFVIPDERSAGYIGVGMAQKLNAPVVVVCTSGTAVTNLFPAICEAYYRQVPIIVLTADRPPEWIDQADGQTIRQDNIFQNHAKGFYSFPLEDTHPDVDWHCERLISEAINLSIELPPGPVHINIPLREPLYPSSGDTFRFPDINRIINKMQINQSIPIESWESLLKEWPKSGKILIVGGQQRYDADLIKILNKFIAKYNVPVVGDVISNLHNLTKNIISFQDLFLLSKNEKILKSLQPDLLITFGKSVISKNLKLFLRKYNPLYHWHIQPAGNIPDTFQSITTHIPTQPNTFFREASNEKLPLPDQDDYLRSWINIDYDSSVKVDSFFPADQFSELEATRLIFEHLPDTINLHLANSLPVRLVNFFGKMKSTIEVFSNRGTSGIDGCNSTVLGTALESDILNLLITGDMAFIYDRNAFWHNYVPGNLRIVVLNNHGGGIFRMIDGPSSLPELETYFETVQNLSAEYTAKDHGFEYNVCSNRNTLINRLKTFFDSGEHPKILEIHTNGKTNKTIVDQFKSQFK